MTTHERKPVDWSPWPVSIVAFFVVAIAGAVAFVLFCNLQGTDLVAPDYYERELRYQAQIDQIERTRRLPSSPSITYSPERKVIALSIPLFQGQSITAGELQLYRPSAAKLDRQIALKVDGGGRQEINAESLQPGLWRVRLVWEVEDRDYLLEERIVIPTQSS